MSDKRAIITITTSVAAIALVFGLMVGISAAPNNITTQSTPLGILGHVTLQIADSDGNIKAYIQSDNFNSDTTSDCIAADLFAPGNPPVGPAFVDPGCGIFSFMGIGFDISNPNNDDQAALLLESNSARTACVTTAVKAVNVGGASSAQVKCVAAAHTITAADITAAAAIEQANINLAATLILNRIVAAGNAVDCADLVPVGVITGAGVNPNGDGVVDSCEISEIGLFDQLALGGNMYGRITIATLAGAAPPTAQYVKAGDTITGTYNSNIG